MRIGGDLTDLVEIEIDRFCTCRELPGAEVDGVSPEVKGRITGFRFPCRVNPERATAVVKNGILTLTLDKAAEAMPRQISVKAS